MRAYTMSQIIGACHPGPCGSLLRARWSVRSLGKSMSPASSRYADGLCSQTRMAKLSSLPCKKCTPTYVPVRSKTRTGQERVSTRSLAIGHGLSTNKNIGLPRWPATSIPSLFRFDLRCDEIHDLGRKRGSLWVRGVQLLEVLQQFHKSLCLPRPITIVRNGVNSRDWTLLQLLQVPTRRNASPGKSTSRAVPASSWRCSRLIVWRSSLDCLRSFLSFVFSCVGLRRSKR